MVEKLIELSAGTYSVAEILRAGMRFMNEELLIVCGLIKKSSRTSGIIKADNEVNSK